MDEPKTLTRSCGCSFADDGRGAQRVNWCGPEHEAVIRSMMSTGQASIPDMIAFMESDPVTPAGAIALHLVGEIDMSGWEPPTYVMVGYGSGVQASFRHYRCSTCLATITEIDEIDLAGAARLGHIDYHRNFAEMYARLTNSVTKLGGVPFVTVEHATPDGN